MPTDMFEGTMLLNYGGLLPVQATPSILGQLVWSWVQYFPIFLSLYWIISSIFRFLVEEQVLKRKIIHDPEYIALAES